MSIHAPTLVRLRVMLGMEVALMQIDLGETTFIPSLGEPCRFRLPGGYWYRSVVMDIDHDLATRRVTIDVHGLELEGIKWG